jgi:hypothetical protein
MTINNIRKTKRGELVIEGFWEDYSAQTTTMTKEEFGKMIKELKEAEMDEEAKRYEKELYDRHNNKDDYDALTGQAKPDTNAQHAREILVEELGHKEEDLYNPLHDEVEGLEKLNKGGEFSTRDAARVLSQIEGAATGDVRGHDIDVTYKGRKKTLTGGSGGTGQTDANAVDQIIDSIVERDFELGHIHEKNKAKRRDAIKNSIYTG